MVCGRRFEPIHTLPCMWYMSSRFSGNSEANASELSENLEEMFVRYSLKLPASKWLTKNTENGSVSEIIFTKKCSEKY